MVAADGLRPLLPPVEPVDVWALAKYRPGEGPLGSLALQALPLLVPVHPVSVKALLPPASKGARKGKQGDASEPSQAGKATATPAIPRGTAPGAVPSAATSESAVATAVKDAGNKPATTAVLPGPPEGTVVSSGVGSPNAVVADGVAEDALGAAIGAPASTTNAYRHIFLTSPPGVGKTTMVQKLLAKLKAEDGDGVRVTGFFTEEIRMDNGQRCGFDVVRVGDDGRRDLQQRCILARIGQDPPKVGKYSIDVVGFEEFALPMLAKKRLEKLPENPRLYTAEDGTVEVVGILEDSEESSSEENEEEQATEKMEDEAAERGQGAEDVAKEGGTDDKTLDGDALASQETNAEAAAMTATAALRAGAEVENAREASAPAADKAENGENDGICKQSAEGASANGGEARGDSSNSSDDSDSDGQKSKEDEKKRDKDAVRMCRILFPLTEQELEVEESKLQPVPEGWKPPRDADDSESEDEHPRPRLCVCDEVGKMELLSLRFPDAFLSSLDSGVSVLGTIPQPARGQIDSEVVETVKKRPDVRVMKITRNNRDSLTEQAYVFLRESLGLGPPGTGTVRRSKRKLQREAAEREEREKAEAIEREKVAKRERQQAKERDRALQAQKLARKRKIQGHRAREKRKAAALVKQRSQELAKSGILGVEDEADSDSLELQDDQADTLASVEDSDSASDVDEADKVEDLETVEDVDAVFDVEDKQTSSGPRKAPRLAAPLAAKPAAPVSSQKFVSVQSAKAKPMMRPPFAPPPKAKVMMRPAPAKAAPPAAKGKASVCLDADECLDLDD